MADPTVADFKSLFPEFDPLDDAVITVWLDQALATLSSSNWGVCYNEAVLYLTAHNLALSQKRIASAQVRGANVLISSTAGPLTSASGAGLSVSYAFSNLATTGNANQSQYQKTDYGQYYAALKVRCLKRLFVSPSRRRCGICGNFFFGSCCGCVC